MMCHSFIFNLLSIICTKLLTGALENESLNEVGEEDVGMSLRSWGTMRG